MRVWTMLFCLACICGNALAQVKQAHYYVTDMLNTKYNRVETWTIRAISENGRKIYKLTKDTPAKERPQETEIIRTWSVETRYAGDRTYMREVLNLHPREMEPGQRSFGYIEERTVDSDEIVDAWPLFCEVEEVVGGMRATFTAYIRDGFRLEIVRDYEENETFYFPTRESRVLKLGGEIKGHTIYARRE